MARAGLDYCEFRVKYEMPLIIFSRTQVLAYSPFDCDSVWYWYPIPLNRNVFKQPQ